jgi:penicillin G amidase
MGWAKSVNGSGLARLTLAASIVVVAFGGTTGSVLSRDRLQIEGLRAPVAVARDANGIVHVFATNEEDLALGQGWAHARDRLFQMDLFRRQASGTLAELLGQAALPSDVELRTLGLRRAAACSLKLASEGCPFSPAQGLSQATVNALQAYAKGVNAFVAANGLPPEYAALGLTRFSDWTALDSVTVAKGLAFELSFDLDDLENTEALVAYTTAGNARGFDGEALFFEDLFRSAPFEPVAVIPSKAVSATTEAAAAGERAAVSEKAGAGGRGEGTAADMARRYLARVRQTPMLKNAFGSMRLSRGSNAWVISGARTAGSGALLANDPHLDLTTPSLFYPIHLSAPPSGADVVGDGFAGLPFILSGRNLRVACGITTIGLDVTDFYAEQVVPDAGSPGGLRISHQPPDDALDRVIAIPELFRFKDQNGAIIEAPPGTVPPATLIVPRRNFGPLLDDPGDGESLSVQYTGFSATRELDAARMMMKARNLNDVAASLQLFDVGSQSLTCADSAGRIGYFVSGEIPLREDLQAGAVNGLPPFFIRNGLAGNEWLPMPNPPRDQAVPFQILPFSEMPQVVDPPEGFIISANNDPLGLNFDNDPLNTPRLGDGGIYYLSPRFNPGLRAFRIRQLLDRGFENGRVGFETMRDIQADIVLRDAQVFLPFIIQAFNNALSSGLALAQDPGVAEAVGRLRVWDGSTPTGVEEGYDAADDDGERRPPSPNEQASSVAATIYSVWRGQFIRRTVLRTLAEAGVGDFDPSSQQLLTAVRNLLDRFPERGGIGASGLNFFNVPGVADPATRRDIIILESLKSALDLLRSAAFAPAFGGSANQGDYRWGRLHRLLIDHPLGDDFSITGGRDDNPFRPPFGDLLPGLPVDGGLETVDAASHTSRANTLQDFEFRQGPLRRFVSSLGGSRRTESSLPGGVSGDVTRPFFNNLLGEWLTNETFRWRQLPLGAIESGEVVILTPG